MKRLFLILIMAAAFFAAAQGEPETASAYSYESELEVQDTVLNGKQNHVVTTQRIVDVADSVKYSKMTSYDIYRLEELRLKNSHPKPFLMGKLVEIVKYITVWGVLIAVVILVLRFLKQRNDDILEAKRLGYYNNGNGSSEPRSGSPLGGFSVSEYDRQNKKFRNGIYLLAIGIAFIVWGAFDHFSGGPLFIGALLSLLGLANAYLNRSAASGADSQNTSKDINR